MRTVGAIELPILTGSPTPNPAAGNYKLFARSDGIYQLDSAGVATNLAAAGGGGTTLRPFYVSTVLGTAAATSSIITFPASPVLNVFNNVTGYAAAGGVVGIRFGTTATPESGARYWHRSHANSPGTTTAVWGNAANTINATGILVAPSTATLSLGRMTTMQVANAPGLQAHPINFQTNNSSNAPGTVALSYFGSGEYVSTTAGQIISAQLWVSGGNLNANTSLVVEGFAP